MDKAKLLAQLMSTFLDELEETTKAMGRDLLLLERTPTTAARGELVHRLFRSAHSLKGASRAVGVRPVEVACHGLEAILTTARELAEPLLAEQLELLLVAT